MDLYPEIGGSERLPGGGAPTSGLTRIDRSLMDSPRGALDKYPWPFAMERVDGPHVIATANQMPNVPGAVLITCGFQAASKGQIDVSGSIDLPIKNGGMRMECCGQFEMTGHRAN